MQGETLGSYRVIKKLGQGGMGTVYLAEHTLIGRKAAIKLLLPELSQKQDIVTRFFNEAKASSAIDHPGIVQVFDFGYHDSGSAYIIMELLMGESLEDRVRRLRKLPELDAARVVRQCAGALAAAHAAGIIHRDLKPGNIFLAIDPELDGGERAKILDFGIAKLTDAGSQVDQMTRTGSMMGTPLYMSPEQCRGAGTVDHRSDIYALGCVLFRIVCGRPPFVAEGMGDVIACHLREPPPSLRSIDPTLSPQLDEIVQRTLAKSPDARFANMTELATALRLLSQRGWGGSASRESGSLASSRAGTAPPSTEAIKGLDLGGLDLGLGLPHTPTPAPAASPTPSPATPAMPMHQATPQAMPGPHAAQHGWAAPVPTLQAHAAPPAPPTPVPLDPGSRNDRVSYPAGMFPASPPTTLGGAAAQQIAGADKTRRNRLLAAVAATLAAAGIAAAVVLGTQGSSDPGSAPGAEVADKSTAAADIQAAGQGGTAQPTPTPAPEPTQAPAVATGTETPAAPPEQTTAADTESQKAAETITVTIESKPAGANVHLPGKREPLGQTPYVYTAASTDDEVTLELKQEGYQTKRVKFAGDRSDTVEVTLKPSTRSSSSRRKPADLNLDDPALQPN